MRLPLSVIVLTYNEERNIAHALESVAGFVERVFVVDSGSTDATIAACSGYDNVEVRRHPFENYGGQWNWAVDSLPIATEWVMKLDADEWVPEQCMREIRDAISSAPSSVGAFALWRKFVFMGRWLKHMVPKCYDVRLWRNGKARFEERSVNEHLIADGDLAYLKEPIMHQDRKGLSAWVWRHNRYSTMEAEEHFRSRRSPSEARLSGSGIARRRFLKERIWPHLPCKPALHFLHLYVGRLGFLDGREGLAYAKLRYFYYYLIELKKREGRREGEVSCPDVMGRPGASEVDK